MQRLCTPNFLYACSAARRVVCIYLSKGKEVVSRRPNCDSHHGEQRLFLTNNDALGAKILEENAHCEVYFTMRNIDWWLVATAHMAGARRTI